MTEEKTQNFSNFSSLPQKLRRSVAHLATISAANFEKICASEASRLGMEPETLSSLVGEAREERRSAFAMAASEEDSLLVYPQLRWLGIKFSRPWIAKLEAEGKFPQRLRVSSRSVAWSSREIQAWLEAHKAARPQVSPEKTNA